MALSVSLIVNGTSHSIEVDDPAMPLLYALRDELHLNNPHFGCGLAQCGVCTVLLDGEPVRSCVTPAKVAEGKQIVTLAGLGSEAHPHALQIAFADLQATQCGYCLNGWIMTAAALVQKNPRASMDDIKAGLSNVKCRCGAHLSIMRAVARVTGAA